jgi:DNA-damage-inducible protein D
MRAETQHIEFKSGFNEDVIETRTAFAKTLEYADYRNFLSVVEKAKEACKNSSQRVLDHFVEVNEMIIAGEGAEKQVDSVKLSRYACYLIVQNADPSKEAIALGQTYFAVQTRLQELTQMEKYNTLTSEDEKRLFLRNEPKRHNTELAANLFRATQTEEKLRRKNIQGKRKANETHFEVGKKVRKTIKDLGGTMPEELPATESIKKLEGRVSKIKRQSIEKNKKQKQ